MQNVLSETAQPMPTSLNAKPGAHGIVAVQGSIVFLVDDDAAIRKGMTRLLQLAGYQTDAFASAEEFLARSCCEGPACLILDVRLPGLNGLELQQTLAREDRQLPIIFITGMGNVPM